VAVRVVQLTPEEMRDHVDAAIGVYAAAMGYPASVATTRRGYFAEHTHRPGYLAVAAMDRRRLVGFGYGYLSVPGQWWNQQVRNALRPGPTDWMDEAFEIAELHVAPRRQGRGIGRTLLTDLMTRAPSRRVLLSTPEGPTRAFALYRSAGFLDVLRDYHFPGDSRPFAVLGVDRGDSPGSP
jgi:ribosomal protein S18 acetylase RimI-like enzyme